MKKFYLTVFYSKQYFLFWTIRNNDLKSDFFHIDENKGNPTVGRPTTQ